MSKYTKLISQNIASLGARRIGIYDVNGNRVGAIPLGSLTPPNPAQKLYSFGALSDVHMGKAEDTNEQADFAGALEYLNHNESVNFICICGDLTDSGDTGQLSEYKSHVTAYSPDTPVYAIAGNHDATKALAFDTLLPYTGKNLWYSFEYGVDVFIMLGEQAWNYECPFSAEEMRWLYETLEANRNKRCFVFQHLLSFDGCGNPYPEASPTTDILGCENTSRFSNAPGRTFLSLMRHYKNCIWFHGHSHTAFECQLDNPLANYDDYYGIHSVHIPSVSSPRRYNGSKYVDRYSESEGYVVEVYENGIHLRGRDFAYNNYEGRWLPIASYWLDTTLQTIPAGTYSGPMP